ncbi:hypothetical protein BJ875DRAFT_488775 [Amylocarpus encephaloides]|uniref:BZIP domain-containing protein n=1 Tax=Amylocarpus encephaloides TaxID=45428 RepID=A0A9P7YAE1_9HELO|nr:hypothetical protein BJ875DRAFT_488775 [Amylocarpus encephaloides]
MPQAEEYDRRTPQKRIVTAARKEQNRMASRAYRQKKRISRKKKQHYQDEMADRRSLRELRPHKNHHLNVEAFGSSIGTEPGVDSAHEETAEDLALDRIQSYDWRTKLPPSNNVLASNDLSHLPAATESPSEFNSELITAPLSLHEPNDNSASMMTPHSFPSVGGARNYPGIPALHKSSSLREAISNIWKESASSTEQGPEELLGLSLRGCSRIGEISPDDEQSQPYPPEERDGSRRIEVAATTIEEDFVQAAVPDWSNTGHTWPLPDLHGNYLQLPQTSILTACLYNSLSLGINLQDLMTAHFCSPFYRPGTNISDNPRALLAASYVPSVPEHLQPTLPQILFPHHACFDLIPFPRLRARAIAFAASKPRLFNPLDLKKDVIHEGLMCWYRGSDSIRGSGQPWDMCSWEIAPWFRNKWRMLLDGEEVQVWKQSIALEGLSGVSE